MTTAQTVDEWKAVPITNEVSKALQHVGAQVGQVLDGKRLAMFVFGGSGLGKNHIVERELAARNIKVPFITPVSVNDLLNEFKNATHNRRKPLPLVFDEARLIFETPANLNVIKDATDTNAAARRFHSGHIWFEEEEIENDDGEIRIKRHRRKGVSLKAPIIAMTNRNLNEFDRKVRDDADAVTSRAPPIQIPNDPLATWEYIVHLALSTDLLTHYQGRSLSLAMRADIIAWFTSHLHDLKQVSIRTILNVRNAFASASEGLLESELGLMLKPTNQRSLKQGPKQLNWIKLKKALG